MASYASDSKTAWSSETQHGVVIVGAGYVCRASGLPYNETDVKLSQCWRACHGYCAEREIRV